MSVMMKKNATDSMSLEVRGEIREDAVMKGMTGDVSMGWMGSVGD